MLLLSSICYSQEFSIVNIFDTLNQKNKLILNTEKITNTYFFAGTFDYLLNTNYGNFRLYENYKGRAFTSQSQSFRDDELFILQYNYPLINSINLLFNQNWSLSSDSRAIGLNESQRINTNIGLRYDLFKNSYLETSGGYENNTQIGFQADGYILSMNYMLSKLQFDEYLINTQAKAEYIKLHDDRTNTDVDIVANLSAIYGLNDVFQINVGYKNMNRDLYTTLFSDTTIINPIERRYETNYFTDFLLSFLIFSPLSTNIKLSFAKQEVEKSYNKSYINIPITNVNKNIDLLQLSFNGEVVLKLKHLQQNIGFNYNSMNEARNITKKYSINEEDEESLKALEQQLDYSSSSNKFFAKTKLDLSKNDSLIFSAYISKRTFDTPSELNVEDRDELSILSNLGYYHKFSNILSASILGEIQMLHLVYIKKESSSSNYWSRVIRFAPSIIYKTHHFIYNPELEVLANYTIYDYEKLFPDIPSISFRQISYKDSLFIFIKKNISLHSNLTLRYYEMGLLFWSDFKESPQNKNIEVFAKIMLMVDNQSGFAYGSGIRYYTLDQSMINNSVSKFSSSGYNQYSIGPEARISYITKKNSSISINGWYELQFYNNQLSKKEPNVYIALSINL